MIVRRIREDELKRCQELFAVAFESPMGMDQAALSPMEYVDRIRENPRSREDVHWDSHWAAFGDDDSTMLATFTVIPWEASFDGHAVGMGGIGGVASLPQYRRGGAIRACFRAALEDMYARGMALSYLYPFSNAFYRRFGYELACDAVRWRLRLEGMPAAEVPGRWKLCEPGQDLSADIRAVDAPRQRRYNCMVIAGDTEYLWTGESPFAKKEYTYVYYDGSGAPSAYMTIAPQPGRELTCKRFVFNDRQGFLGLLALLKRLSADHSHARMALPTDVDLQGLLPEYSFGNVSREVEQQGMARVIDAARVLRLARTRGEGALRVRIADDFIPANDGAFEVAFAPGRENAVRRTDAAPDVELTVQDFTRLILGCCALDPEWLPGVKLHCPLEDAQKLFYKKPAFISQYF